MSGEKRPFSGRERSKTADRAGLFSEPRRDRTLVQIGAILLNPDADVAGEQSRHGCQPVNFGCGSGRQRLNCSESALLVLVLPLANEMTALTLWRP